MANVVNNIVKMEWDKNGFLLTTGKAFVVASKVYETDGGQVSVFFNSNTAFVWDSGAVNGGAIDLWAVSDLIPWIKKNLDGAFPTQYDEYVSVIDFGASKVNADVIAKYGLGAHVADIEARLNDLEKYGEETDSKMKMD